MPVSNLTQARNKPLSIQLYSLVPAHQRRILRAFITPFVPVVFPSRSAARIFVDCRDTKGQTKIYQSHQADHHSSRLHPNVLPGTQQPAHVCIQSFAYTTVAPWRLESVAIAQLGAPIHPLPAYAIAFLQVSRLRCPRKRRLRKRLTSTAPSALSAHPLG